MRIDIRWSDEKLRVGRESIVVVVDTLRATSVIPAALKAGAQQVLALPTIEAAKAQKRRNPEGILAGERSGQCIEDFDCGNSPVAMRATGGKEVFLTTGNFCSILGAVTTLGAPVVAASCTNARAVAAYIRKKRYSHVLIVATGTYHWHGRRLHNPKRTEEDLIGAEMLANELRAEKQSTEEIVERLWHSEYARYLLAQDANKNEEDLKVCFALNSCTSVPLLTQQEEGIFIFTEAKE